jgi:hypothetical protein
MVEAFGELVISIWERGMNSEGDRSSSWTDIFRLVDARTLWAVIGIVALVLLISLGNSLWTGACFDIWGGVSDR